MLLLVKNDITYQKITVISYNFNKSNCILILLLQFPNLMRIIFGYLLCLFALNVQAQPSESNNINSLVPVYYQQTVSNDSLKKIEHKHDRFLHQNLGHFSNKESIADVPGERESQFIVIPIFQKQRAGEFWIYIEYFSPKLVSQPIEQRIQHYIKKDRYTYQIKTYHLKDPVPYINAWQRTNAFDNFNIKEGLVHDEFCDMLATADEEKDFYHKFVPMGTDCPVQDSSSLAKYSYTSFDVFDEGYIMCIEFLDENKKILKNCHNGGTLFKRLDYLDPSYVSLEEKTAVVTVSPKEDDIDEEPKEKKPKKEKKKKEKKGK